MSDELLMPDTELEDFNAPDATYELWVLGYNRNLESTGFEFMFGSYTTPDEAVAAATELGPANIRTAASIIPEDVYCFNLEIETVVDLGDGETENAGTIYRKTGLPNPGSKATLLLKTADYSFTDSGTLRVANPEADKLQKGDSVMIRFIEEEAGSTGAFLVVAKEPGAVFLEFVD